MPIKTRTGSRGTHTPTALLRTAYTYRIIQSLTVPGDGAAEPTAPLAALLLDESRHLLQQPRVARPFLAELRLLVVELLLHLALQTRNPKEFRRGRPA